MNESVVINAGNLSQDDLLEAYKNFGHSYRQLKEEFEKCKQDLHQNRLQKNMLLSTQNDLQHELDSVSSTHQEELEALIEKHCSTVEHLKKKNYELQTDKIQLETDIDELAKQLLDSKADCDELKTKVENHKPATRVSDSFSKSLELENENLQLMLKEMAQKLAEREAQSSEQHLKIEELTEKILCLEDNLDSKKSEIEEKNDAMESLQEKVHEMSVELALLKTAPGDANRKGNSLFAEVDDQRQKMKVILQGERAHYLEMKRSFNAKEMEIRRLKREAMNIRTEIQTCSSLLMRGEQIAIQTLSTHVSQLQSDNKRLQNLLASTEKKLIDLAQKTPSLGWIESVISTANNETREINDKLFKLMVDKTSLADNLSKNQRELAKARLDCVKFKILLRRIVDKSNLELCQNDFLDIGLDEEVFEGLKINPLESLDEQMDLSNCSSFQLSESTVELLGGRERLGNVIPLPVPAAEKSTDKPKDDSVNENKENLRNIIKEHQQAAKTPIAPPKPFHRSNPSPKLEKERTVKFSNSVETKVIDSNQEQFEESKQARKRQAVIVKRIVIPSKPAAKNS